MRRNDCRSQSIDCALQHNRSEIHNKRHKSHCKPRRKKLTVLSFHRFPLVLLRYNIPELKQDITKTKHCRKCLRDDCRPGSTLNPHMKSIHKQQIQSNIHEHGNNQTIKRRPAVANRAQYICTHVINRHKYNAI